MIKTIDGLKKLSLLETQQVGRVVENKDPRMLQRVKVYIRGIYEDADITKLPWVFPKSDSGLGGRPDSSNFQVPEIGSEVLVSWPNKDVYHPFYQGRRLNDLTTPKEPFTESYPNSYGQIDSTLQWWKVNKELKYTEYFSKELGKLIRFDGEGNLVINIPKNLIIQIGNELQIGVGGSSTINSGVNNVFTCGNIFYVGATNGFSTTGGGGGINAFVSGPVHIQSGNTITLDAPTVHHNSGMGPGPSPVPSEVSALQSAMSSIQSKIQELTQQAQSIADRLSQVQEKIGK